MKIIKTFFAITIVLTISLTALYLFMDREALTLNEQTRASLPGEFIELDKGVVHYEIKGENRKPNVILVHGFSASSFVWEPTFGALADSGFSVLRFDLYGRGLSDRPDSDYAMTLYVEQLKALMDGLDVDEPVNIVGLAMGGAVVTHFTNRYPELVNKLILIDPLVVAPNKPEAEPLKKPLLGEYLSKVVLVTKLRKGLEGLVYDANLYPEWDAKFDEQTHYEGYAKAMLASVRYLMGKDFTSEYRKLGELGKPVQLFWGKNDKMIPIEDSKLITDVVPDVEFHAIEKAGHVPNYEQPQEVNQKMIQFLKG